MKRVTLALAVAVALGLLSRLYPIGWLLYDKSLGDVLYAVAVYLVLALLTRWRSAMVAPLAAILCLSIEGFQATGVPARWARVRPVGWLLGTTFSWHDVLCYLVGVALITGLDMVLLRPGRFNNPASGGCEPPGASMDRGVHTPRSPHKSFHSSDS
ncbi:MAG: DUF2809 domain-containing protein [Planctomycetes bacterium]|nr:DUF2809 domain-containing protein [Planctomycetota bacterium]